MRQPHTSESNRKGPSHFFRSHRTLRFSGSPTQLPIKATHRRVRCKRVLDFAVHLLHAVVRLRRQHNAQSRRRSLGRRPLIWLSTASTDRRQRRPRKMPLRRCSPKSSMSGIASRVGRTNRTIRIAFIRMKFLEPAPKPHAANRTHYRCQTLEFLTLTF